MIRPLVCSFSHTDEILWIEIASLLFMVFSLSHSTFPVNCSYMSFYSGNFSYNSLSGLKKSKRLFLFSLDFRTFVISTSFVLFVKPNPLSGFNVIPDVQDRFNGSPHRDLASTSSSHGRAPGSPTSVSDPSFTSAPHVGPSPYVDGATASPSVSNPVVDGFQALQRAGSRKRPNGDAIAALS